MIVIPMAGMSSRFFREGYNIPKYKLEAHGKTLFEHSVLSFKQYFNTEYFVFIVKDDKYNPAEFVNKKALELGIVNYQVITLEHNTKGQAETVYLGVSQLKGLDIVSKKHPGLTVFNIDTIHLKFKKYEPVTNLNGYLEVFEGEGDNWSYIKPMCKLNRTVKETAEKKAISNLCSNGLYYFEDFYLFEEAFLEYSSISTQLWTNGELYIAPLYNSLIEKGKSIKYKIVDRESIIFCGTPEEYKMYLGLENENTI
ncbi:capsular biosynthesis protein [Vibrio crassostreae]|uniref:capsular biosynthesis protein n=1 Tax=Vibrio crassostreae TaxID=246167 RepID=UPI000F51129A|nr:capsular biosynthesis protein [Vibrio crassostreae]RPF00124.1 hypothetical protein EDB17_4002 [Vibrio crassostreae]